MDINILKEEIKKQREINIRLYKSIPVASHEDPSNLKAQPILKQWREGSVKIKSLIKKLQELELAEKEKHDSKLNKKSKTFVNSFGEATQRYITTATYERQQRRADKELLSFLS